MTPLRLLLVPLAATLAAAALTGCVVAPPQVRQPLPASTYRTLPPPPSAPVVSSAGPSLYFYPQRNQSASQQDRDRYECYRWAVRQTGVDPGMQPLQRALEAEPAPVPRDGRGAAVGAVTGAMVGGAMSSPRHAGTGMVLGALFGGLMGAAAQESQAQAIEREQDAYRDRHAVRQAQATEGFRRAMSACMVGRDYAVR